MENKLFTFDKAAEDCLSTYSFPGNVRELRNIVIRLSAKYSGKCTGAEELKNKLEILIAPVAEDNNYSDVKSLEHELFRLDDKLKN